MMIILTFANIVLVMMVMMMIVMMHLGVCVFIIITIIIIVLMGKVFNAPQLSRYSNVLVQGHPSLYSGYA